MRRHSPSILTTAFVIHCAGWLAPGWAPAATVLRCGETREQAITSKFDFLTFDAEAGEAVSITVATAPGQDANFAPEFQLEDPDADSVFFTDGSRICRSVVHQCEAILPATGTYTITVNDDGKKQTGTYFITLEAVSATAQGLPNGPSDEPGEGPTCRRVNDLGKADGTQPIAIGVPAGGALDVVGETDTFTFLAAAGQLVALTLEPVTPLPEGFDPRWKLFAPDGTALGGDCSAGETCARGPLAADGVYTAKVFESDFDTTGDYTLVLSNPDLPTTTTSTTTSTTTLVGAGTSTTTTLFGGETLYELSRVLRRTTALTPAEELGTAVAADATRLAIGVPFDQTRGRAAGTVYVRSLEGVPPLSGFGEAVQQIDKPGGAIAADRFGAAVALLPDAVAVGAPGANAVSPGGTTEGAGVVYLATSLSAAPQALVAPQPRRESDFGAVLAVRGSELFVGAPRDGANRAGSVYLYENGTLKRAFGGADPDAGALDAIGRIGPGDNFGAAIAAFDDQLAIGAPADGMAAGRVFVFDRTSGQWRVLESPTASRGDRFGAAVAYVGSTLVIGAPGASRVYSVPAVGQPPVLILDRPDLAGLGTSLAPLDVSFLVGAPAAEVGTARGGVVLRAALSGAVIDEFAKEAPSDDDRYGAVVAATEDRVVIGAPGDDSGNPDAGAVYVYRLLEAGEEAIFRKRVVDAGFGSAMAADDAVIAVGAPGDAEGNGGVYSFDARPVPCRNEVCMSLAAVAGATEGSAFGQAVALAGGATLVGAPGDRRTPGGERAGTASLVLLRGQAQQGPKIESPDDRAQAGDQFGFAVAAIENDLLVGAPLRSDTDTGAVFVFDTRPQPPQRRLTLSNPVPTTGDFFGAAIAVEGDTVAVGAPFDSSARNKAGAVYLFRRSTGELLEGEPLVSPVAAERELFGAAIAMSDELIVVGAPSEDPLEPGRTYVFERRSRGLLRTIDNPAGEAGDRFGAAVAMVDGRILVGAPLGGTFGPETGVAYLVDPATGLVRQIFENPAQGAFDRFGASVAPGPSGLLIGAPLAGRVYVYGDAALEGLVARNALAATNGLTVAAAAAAPECGNGNREGAEQCDDGNDVDTDDCRNDCTKVCCVIDPLEADRCNDFDPCTADSFDAVANVCVNVDTGQCCSSDDACAGGDQTCRLCAGCSLFPWDCCQQGATCLLSSPECQDDECFERPLCECQGGLTCTEPGAAPTEAMEEQFRQACEALRLEEGGEVTDGPLAAARTSARDARRALKAARRETKKAFKDDDMSRECRKQYLQRINLVRRSIPAGNTLRGCVREKSVD